MSRAREIMTKVALFGVGGWVVENALCGDRYSALFKGHKVPFLPIYAAGGLAVTATEPYVAKLPLLARGLAYSIVGTAIEYVGCKIDRDMLHARSWDYGQQDALARSSEGCVNFAHSALWGGLGLIAEKV